MKPYQCLIIDDERPALQLLTAYLKKMPQLELVGSCENAMDALAQLQSRSVDMLFLDIQMPEFTGLDLLKMLTKRPQVILTTAYREYAVEGFQLEVTDYLVKPFSFERFVQATNKAINHILRSNGSAATDTAPEVQKTAGEPPTEIDHFFVRTNHKMEKVVLGEILYIESMREYSCIYTKERRFVINNSMQRIIDELPTSKFIRVHRSYIVSLNKIEGIKGNTIVLVNKEIPIGTSFRKAFFKRIKLL
ncbi:MAG: LytTR family DNA-binding domain-containing protein [Bacteroidota bacterium]